MVVRVGVVVVVVGIADKVFVVVAVVAVVALPPLFHSKPAESAHTHTYIHTRKRTHR